MSKTIYIRELDQKSMSEILGIPYINIDIFITEENIEYIDPLEQVRLMNDSWRGQHHTEKTKKIISEKNKGKQRTEETRKNISIAATGRKHTKSSKRHMSKIKIGNRNPMFGRKNPNASKWNSENKSIKILVTMLNKDKKTFDKIQELGLYLNKSKQLAQKLCDPRYSHLLCKYGIESIDKL